MLKYITNVLKGAAMGAADVVPGVSGGTIALITGIYEELVDSIKSIDAQAVKLLFKDGVKSFWQHINGWFLVSVFAGVFLSVFSLAKILETLLSTYPVMVWSFFFGLIIASAITILKKIKKWELSKVIAVIAGTIVAYFVTVLTPAQTPETWWFVMFSGALAICAMILPGISGAFILLLLGKYAYIIGAISQFDITIIAIFGVGAVIGILSFSNLLSYLLHRFHDITISVLAGFMIGSLNKVWPWKETVETYVNRHGEIVPLVEKNVGPNAYEQITESPSFWGYAILFAVIGFMIIWGFEFFAKKLTK
ncbi:polyprenyl-phosphate transporter [Salinivirga cyanobacteriivorans]